MTEIGYPSENILCVIIGVKDYDSASLHKLESVENNVHEFKKCLTNRKYNINNKTGIENSKDSSGIPDDNIFKLTDGARDSNQVRRQIKDFIDKSVKNKKIDLIIFYYSGHGAWDNEKDEYYLTVSKTQDDDLKETALKMFDICDILTKYNTKVALIIDSCFSENAFDSIKTKSDFYIMASSAYNETTKYPLNQEFSSFTSMFLETVKNGVKGAGSEITFDEIFEEVKRKLELIKYPSPKKLDKNGAGNIIFDNNAFKEFKETFDLDLALINIHNSFYNNTEIDDNMKRNVLKCFPLNISVYLRNILSDDENKLLNDPLFLRDLYYQIIHFLSFLFIKDLDKKDVNNKNKLMDGDIDLFKSWKKPKSTDDDINKFHIAIIEKACTTYKNLLFINELRSEAPFLLSKVQSIEQLLDEDGNVPEDLLVNFRRLLFNLLVQLSFLKNYDLIAVRFIDVKKSFSDKTIFRHEVSKLFGEDPTPYSYSALLASEKDFLYNAVVFIPKIEAPNQLNDIIKNSTYLNLWPFVIDGCGNDKKAEKPQVCLFEDVTDDIIILYNYRPVQLKKEREAKREYSSLKAFPGRDEWDNFYKL